MTPSQFAKNDTRKLVIADLRSYTRGTKDSDVVTVTASLLKHALALLDPPAPKPRKKKGNNILH